MKHNIFEIQGHDFKKEVLESTLPVLVEFTAEWCPPCKMLAPIMEALAHKYEGQLQVCLLDSDTNQQIVQEYGIYGIPTIILYVDGQPVERMTGYKPQERIESKITPHLAIERT